MKNLLTYLFIVLGTLSYAQPEVKFLEAFGDKDLSTVANLLSDNIKVCINDNVKDVNRKEAISRLSGFIAKNKINRKKILHNGKSTDKGSSYKVARVKTETGSYRIFAYSENEGNTRVIKEIRIDKM